jgi:transcription elongation factor Elf1
MGRVKLPVDKENKMETAICEKCGDRYPVDFGCARCRVAEREKATPIKPKKKQ